MADGFKTSFSGSSPDDKVFTLFDLHALTRAYNSNIDALRDIIIPYVATRLNGPELKSMLKTYSRADMFGVMNKMVSGMALMRASGADANVVSLRLLDNYERFFCEIKTNLENLRYDFAFTTIIALDMFHRDLRQFMHSPRATKENKTQLKKLGYIVNDVKIDLGSDSGLLNGAINFSDASMIAHRMHSGELHINMYRLACGIQQLNDLQNADVMRKKVANRNSEYNRMARLSDKMADEVAFMHTENAELRKKLADTEKRAQKQIDDDALLEQVFGCADKDKEIAELKRQIDAMTKENMKLRANQKYKLFGRQH